MSLRHLGGGTIGGLLRARADAAPDKLLLVTADERYTYRAADTLADNVGRSLGRLGFAKGDVGALLVGNDPAFIMAWFGMMRAGMLQVPINTAYKADFLTYLLEHSGTRLLVAEPQFLPSLATASPAVQKLDALVFTSPQIPNGALDLGAKSTLAWPDFLKLSHGSESLPNVEPSDLSAILYTSGTTGRSKGVLTPHLHNVIMGAEAAAAWGMSSHDVLYTCLPLFHGNAQLATVMNAMSACATVALGRRFSASRFWDEVRTLEATEFNVIGSMLYMLMAQPASPNDRQHLVRKVFAAPAPEAVFYQFEHRFGLEIIEGYGQTEIKNVAYNPLTARRPGSFGKPTPTSILTVLGPTGNELAPGEVGEIAYRPTRPDIMCRGYFRDEAASLAAMKDLWWHTGDLGYRDADGYFYFVDRSRDSLRRRGENISSYEVESVLVAHPSVLDGAAVSVKSDIAEDEVMVVLQLKPDAEWDPVAFFRFCDSKLPYFMVPRYYRIVEALPYTPNGKVRKTELREAGITSDTWDSASSGLKPSRVAAN